MKINFFFIAVLLLIVINGKMSAQKTDTYVTAQGDLVIHFLGHASLLFEFNKMAIYADPFSKVADYSQLPKASLIVVTHSHGDHFDKDAIAKIKDDRTQMIYTQECENKGKFEGVAYVLKNGDKQVWEGITIEAVAAYNIEHKRPDGNPFHPKGEGNGYVITFGGKRVYIAGDTENIPEMKDLGNIDIAFLPMNLPYTMTPEQAADAAKMVHPKIFYPYHFGETDVNKLLDLMKDVKNVEVKVRGMK